MDPMDEEQRKWNERYSNQETPWDRGVPNSEFQRIIREHAIAPCRALEVGCGTGTNAVWLARQGFTVTAFDLAPLAIQRALERNREAGTEINFFAGNALALPPLGEPFPFVYDCGVYHGLRRAHWALYRNTLERVVAPGGHYMTLAANAHEPCQPGMGPQGVTETELVTELGSIFRLAELKEYSFESMRDGQPVRRLFWTALWRRPE